MSIALSWRWLGAGTTLAGAARRTRGLGLEALLVQAPVPDRREGLEALGKFDVEACAVLAPPVDPVSDAPATAVRAAATTASEDAVALEASWIVVDGGGLGARAGRALAAEDARLLQEALAGDAPDATSVRTLRDRTREARTEELARALHGPLREGAPLAIRGGAGAADLLGEEETGWLLEALPRLGLFLDPVGAWRLWRLGLGPEPAAWLDAHGARTRGVFLHGAGPVWAGGAHPAREGPDWGSLASSLPRFVPWILDLDPDLAEDEVEDARRYVESVQDRGRLRHG